MSMPLIIALSAVVFTAAASLLVGFCRNYHKLSKENEAKLAIRIAAFSNDYNVSKIRYQHEELSRGLFAPFNLSREAFCGARNSFRVGNTRSAHHQIELAYKHLKQVAVDSDKLDCTAKSLGMLDRDLPGKLD